MIIVIMGPSGCGKSTISNLLSKKLGWPYLEGDDYHSEKNRQKMAMGKPLDDGDRMPWLNKIQDTLLDYPNAILACSALKKVYRETILNCTNNMFYILLDSDVSLLESRLNNRIGHFFNPKLLTSQLEILEPFAPNEKHLTISANLTCEDIVHNIILHLKEYDTSFNDCSTPFNIQS